MPPRMDHPTPLDIPELLEHCIDYLHDSPRDLKACALVSRHWVYPSQSHLFRAPTVTSRNGIVSVNDAPWERLRDMLALSSHLIRHIQSFNIEGLEAHSSTLHQICYFPFTHLTSVSISIVVFSEARLAIQQLLSLPTLRRVKLGCMFLDCEGYMRVWDRCSPTICHIYLDSKVQGSFSGSPPVATSLTTPLVLESLRIESEPDQVLGYCDSRLFDFSHLKVLSIGRSSLPNFIASVSFAPALGTIQALDISEDFYESANTVVISAFPKLALLRIGTTKWGTSKRTHQFLSTIAASNVLRTIILVPINGSLSSGICEQLDIQLSTIPMEQPPIVEFEIDPQGFDEMKPHFPRLDAKGLLRRTDWRDGWWMSSSVLNMRGIMP